MVKQLRADPRVDVMMCDGARSYFVEMNVTKKPFDDVRVRKAMNYMFNGEVLTQTVLDNLAIPLAGFSSEALRREQGLENPRVTSRKRRSNFSRKPGMPTGSR